MRGAFLLAMAIAVLIIGILVVKDLQTEVDDGVEKTKVVKHAEKSVKGVQDAMWKVKKKASEAAGE